MSAMNLGPYAAFILAAYGIAGAVLAALVCWLVLEGKRQQRLLDAFEARGLRRRAARGSHSL